MAENELPDIGLGTSRNTDPEQCIRTVQFALENGYEHIDTAQDYDNERYVGKGIISADVPREDVFLATKVDPTNLGYEDVLSSTEESLNLLDTEYIDLLYIHWPTGMYEPEETLPAFDKLYEDGIIRHIGLSNFTPQLVEEAVNVLEAPVFALQNEFHPYLQQVELRKFAIDNGYRFIGYSPLLKGKFKEIEEVIGVSNKYDATPAQVVLAWAASKDNVYTIPKATGEEHLLQNFEAANIELDGEDINRIDSIETEERIIWRHDPEFKSPWD